MKTETETETLLMCLPERIFGAAIRDFFPNIGTSFAQHFPFSLKYFPPHKGYSLHHFENYIREKQEKNPFSVTISSTRKTVYD